MPTPASSTPVRSTNASAHPDWDRALERQEHLFEAAAHPSDPAAQRAVAKDRAEDEAAPLDAQLGYWADQFSPRADRGR